MSTSSMMPPGGRSRPGRLLALSTATAVAASLLSVPSGPALATSGPATATDPSLAAGVLPVDAEPAAVTLITGDTVLWQDSGDGNPRVVEIEEAQRDYPVTFDQSGTQEDFYVIPTDVMEHVVAGTVDEELFNIPGLIRQGLDDATTDELPVIVTFDQDRSTQQLVRDADALPATSDATVVDRVNGAGVKVNRGTASTFRQAVFGRPGHGHSTHTDGARGLDGAVERVLLDRILEIDLAESVPQIGAPRAWDAGYTGEGVTVAVLDTGIDSNHSDLAGQVVAAENFTDEPDATDTHGHGTHVASTIAGTGAASDGARTGVAPGADLLSGKVCNAAGQCRTSWIMAGMEWAAQRRADIVNMSLGSETASDGTDVMSQLLNQLSADTGVLFVTSAGNRGPSPRRIGSPGAADAALAVGAVDKSDQMASFSSRGPRLGDHAVKPEITAPGVGIIAARAEGTGIGSPVDDHYTSVNGTSMASPHVAGAAALLAQAHSDLDGNDLKDALVSTAADGGFRWYEQGTGRVDVPAALDSPIYATGTVNLGGIDGQAEQDVVYTNRSADDVTLHLETVATDLSGQPASGITLSTDTLTVPTNDKASVTVAVELDASNLTGQEALGGVITATGPNVALRTGVGFGPPLNRVAIEVLDSNGDRIGTPAASDTSVRLTHDNLNREVGGIDVYSFGTDDGIATGHVPAGIYTVITRIVESDPDTGKDLRSSGIVELEVDIDSDTTLTLDAREAAPVETPTLPRRVEKRNHQVSVSRELAGSGGVEDRLVLGGAEFPVFVTPTPPGELAALRLSVSWTLAEPQPLQPLFGDQRCPRLPFWCYSETPSYVYNLPIQYDNGIPNDLHETITRRDLVEIPSRFHSDYPDVLVQQQFETLLPSSNSAGVKDHVEMWFRPGEVTEYFLADDRVTWIRRVRIERRPEGEPTQVIQLFSDDRFPAVEAGSRRGEERWHEAPMRIGVWDVREETLGWHRQSEQRWAVASRGGLDGDQFTVPFHLMGNSRGHGGNAPNGASWRMWNADTGMELERIGSVVFQLTPGEATYRLEQIEDYPPSPLRTGRATTTWTFTSRPSDEQVPERYKCWIQQAPRQDVCQIQPLIRLEYALGLDIHNRVSAGRAHRFTVTAGHHSKAIDRAAVTSLSVQASFDDGDTWQDARVVGRAKDSWETGGLLPSAAPYQQFRVVLAIPPLNRTSGYVTLRVRAEDANGGTVDQTIHRAYILK